MRVMGIDPGASGAFAIIDNGRLSYYSTFLKNKDGSINFYALQKDMKNLSYGLNFIVIEEVTSDYKWGRSSIFKFGRAFQAAIDSASMLCVPIYFAPPKFWQKHVMKDIEPIFEENSHGELEKKTKLMALKRAQELFPTSDFLATSRSSVPHDGIVDASLIAQFGYEFKNEILEREAKLLKKEKAKKKRQKRKRIKQKLTKTLSMEGK